MADLEPTPGALLVRAQHGPGDPVIPGHPGDGASLQTLRYANVLAEQGRPALQCDLYDDLIQRDGALFSLVHIRRAALAGRPATIVPGGDDRDSMRAADQFAEVWDNLPSRSLISHHAHSSNVYGWGCTESEWEWTGRRYDPVDLYHVRSRLFRIATPWNFLVPGAAPDELLVRTGWYEHEVARMIPGKWIITRRSDSDPVARCALMRPAAAVSILKSQGSAHWFSFLQRYGLPFLLVKIHDFANAAEVATAREILSRWGTDAGAIVAENARVQPEVTDGAAASRTAASDLHQRWVAECNAELTRIWNGGILATETGGNGSYAQASVHNEVRVGNLLEDADRVQDSIRRGLIIPWMRVNGIPGRPPKLVIKVASVSDPELAVKLATDLNAIGYQVDPTQLEDLTGLRIRQRDDAVPEEPAEEPADDMETDDE